MPRLRYRVPKIVRHAAFGRMNDYDLENQSRGRLIGLSMVRHDCSWRNRNRRIVAGQFALQHCFCSNTSLVPDLSLRFDAFSPLPFNAAVEAQWIYGTHWVNLAATLPPEKKSSRDLCSLGGRSRQGLESSAKWLLKLLECSLPPDDQDLEISVVNSLGREVHREFIHRE